MSSSEERITVEVAGRTFELAVRHKEDAGDLYWNRVWPASVGMSEYLVAQGRAALEGVRMLELGCGTALCGIVAASLGAEVVCSDLAPQALELAELNARLNGVELAGTRQLDWCNIPPDLERYPLVIGADVLYDEALVEPLTRTLLAALAPQGRALLSDAIRSPFNALLEHFREVGLEHAQELLDVRLTGRMHRVGIYPIRRRRQRRRVTG